MGTTCKIFKEEISINLDTDLEIKTLTQVGETINDFDQAERIADLCEWKMQDEEHFIGDVWGSTLLDYLLSSTSINTDNIEEDEWYRVEISW